MYKNKVGIIGAGEYGLALNELFLSNKKNEVLIWDLKEKEISNFSSKNDVLSCEFLIFAIPSKFVLKFLEKNSKKFSKNQKVLIGSKGFSSDGSLLSSVFCDFFNSDNICYLSGPGFANEIILNPKITRLNVSGFNLKVAKKISNLFCDKVASYDDSILSSEITSALKNVAAFVCGISYGKYNSLNFKYAIASKVSCEIAKIVNYFEGNCLNSISNPLLQADLYMTASQDKSRNFKFGVEISKGLKFSDCVDKLNYTVESLETIKILNKMYQADNKIFLNLEIFPKVIDLYFERINVDEFFSLINNLNFNKCEL